MNFLGHISLLRPTKCRKVPDFSLWTNQENPMIVRPTHFPKPSQDSGQMRPSKCWRSHFLSCLRICVHDILLVCRRIRRCYQQWYSCLITLFLIFTWCHQVQTTFQEILRMLIAKSRPLVIKTTHKTLKIFAKKLLV